MAYSQLHHGFRNHPKTRHLAILLGVHINYARGLLSALWSWSLEYATDGDLSRFDVKLIESGVDWDGGEGLCIDALIAARFIDRDEHGSLTLHDWMEYAGTYYERVRKQKARRKRTLPRKRGPKNVPEMSRDIPENFRRVPEMSGNVPSRSEEIRSEESRGEERREDQKDPDQSEAALARGPRRPPVVVDDVSRVIAHFVGYHSRSKPGADERGLIRDRFKEGYSALDLEHAIDGCHVSPHHLGQNERRTKYQTLELIVRDSKHVTQFIDAWEAHQRDPQIGPIPPKNQTAAERQLDEVEDLLRDAEERARIRAEEEEPDANGVLRIAARVLPCERGFA